MRCPFCSSEETQVKDSRPAEDSSSIRRRRSCITCGARFTTFERIQLRELIVIKSDEETRQPFDQDKVVRSMQIALRKRPIDNNDIEVAASAIVRHLENLGELEVSTQLIGQLVMDSLASLDVVGYIRYASVYKEFSSPEDFNAFVEEIKNIQIKHRVAAE
jgi:transcriptional repressor NrdR